MPAAFCRLNSLIIAIFFLMGQGLVVGEAWGKEAKTEQAKKSKKKAKKASKKTSKREPRQQQRAGALFPDWPLDEFDYFIEPITGFQNQSNSSGGIETTSVYSELGLGLGLSNIPIPGGNPGVTITPRTALTFGSIASVSEQNGATTKQYASFQRKTAGLESNIYYRWFRYRLGLTVAHIDYENDDESNYADARNIRIVNEPGVLVLPWWMFFLTLDYSQLWSQDFGTPTVKDGDAFLHTRVSFDVLKFWIDAGPGVTVMQRLETNEAQDASTEATYASGQSTYLASNAQATLFWKLYASLRLKYILSASSDIDDRFASVLVPDQKVSNPNAFGSLPEGTLEESVAVGVSNIWKGLGVVWQYHRTIYGETTTSSKREVSNQGYQVTFALNL